ncbi:hypothetical protein TNCV_1894291 [Trichonephila clavipes]|nr:hypothetical protein TNCV_1894291 [Trichonephila clavipes]
MSSSFKLGCASCHFLRGCKEDRKSGSSTSYKSHVWYSVATLNDLCGWRLKEAPVELKEGHHLFSSSTFVAFNQYRTSVMNTATEEKSLQRFVDALNPTNEGFFSGFGFRKARHHTAVSTVDKLWYREAAWRTEAAWELISVHVTQSVFDSMPRRVSAAIIAGGACSEH